MGIRITHKDLTVEISWPVMALLIWVAISTAQNFLF